MKECLFWRVIGVGIVVGLVSIGYGLCKNSPLPSPSFSSAAYADDVFSTFADDDVPHQKHAFTADDRYGLAKISWDERIHPTNTQYHTTMPLTKGQWETPAPVDADGLFGSVVISNELASKSVLTELSNANRNAKPIKITIELDDGRKVEWDLHQP